MALKKDDLDASNNWIKASLCDGEDEKTKELALALEDIDALGKYQVLKRYDEFFFLNTTGLQMMSNFTIFLF